MIQFEFELTKLSQLVEKPMQASYLTKTLPILLKINEATSKRPWSHRRQTKFTQPVDSHTH
jgi:hypothetical protein